VKKISSLGGVASVPYFWNGRG